MNVLRKVTIGGCGFHGGSIEVIEVDESRVWDKARIEAKYTEPWWYPDMMVEVDGKTVRRLGRNVCGKFDCWCVSGARVWDIAGKMNLVSCREYEGGESVRPG